MNRRLLTGEPLAAVFPGGCVLFNYSLPPSHKNGCGNRAQNI